MFDTSIVRARAAAAPRPLTLFVSVLIHSIAVVAAVTLSVAATQVPAQPPRQLELYRPVELPSPPPGPPAGPSGPPSRGQSGHAPPAIQPAVVEDVAPPSIPDQLPALQDVADTGEIGVPGGNRDSVGTGGGGGGGERGGGGEQVSAGPYTPGTLGVTQARVLTRVEPRFPQSMIGAIRNAIVMVHCVIGKDGRIHDPQIVMSSFPPFNESVLEALQQWRFAPGTLRGEPVDTYFELTVKFEVRR